jgi:hypothetical protein
MTKSFTLKDVLMYESETKREMKQSECEKISTSPSPNIIRYILAYAQALSVLNNRITGPLCILLN